MYFVNETQNLNPLPEPSIIDKLAALDIDIKKLRIKNFGTSSSFYSISTAHSLRAGEGTPTRKEPKMRAAIDRMSEIQSHVSSKHSLKSKKTEMSLEEKLLSGFYKVPPKDM
jgi:hypothetical protein